jgi:amidase
VIPPRGHSASGALTPTDISVVGPMARHAEDLALAMPILAGPDVLQQPALRVELPPPRHRRLEDFRVAVWTQSPLCEIDASVGERFAAATAALRQAGAAVDEAARPPFEDAAHHRLFLLLLRAATASRLGDEEFAAQQQAAATLAPDDMSFRATAARGAALSHRDWGRANEERTKLRHAWRAFFQRFDVMLAPVAATAAFPHDHNPDRDRRLVPVNGKSLPYFDQVFWSGPASLCYLPATAAPLGLTASGLPVGMQIIGAEGEDLTTIEFARLLAAGIGGFVTPPGYAQ